MESNASSPSSGPSLEPLSSDLGGDPQTLELILFFLDHLEEQVDVLHEALRRRDLAEIRMISHQLRGASGAYGYPQITELAGGLEDALAEEAELSSITEHVESLVQVCRRACMGRPEHPGA